MPRHSSRSSRSRTRSRSRSERSRTRSRSRSRTRRRSASTSSEDRVQRSPSRTLYDQEVTVEQVPKLIKEQQNFIVDLIAEHKQEVDSKLQARQRRFTSKALEKQYEVNGGFLELVQKLLAALKRDNRRKVKTTLKKLRDQVKQHQEDLVIADTSPNGWLAVARLRNRADIPEHLRRKLERVDKEIWRSKQYGGQKKPGKLQGQGFGGDVRVTRPQQKQSPEELLYAASRQVRAGVCSHCKKENHYYRECPDFWRKVQESREERAKGQPTQN